jgi:hypothetical protein
MGTSSGANGGDGGIAILTADTPRFIVNAQGNVGIGTTAPNKRLHVKASSSLAVTLLQIENSDTGGGGSARIDAWVGGGELGWMEWERTAAAYHQSAFKLSTRTKTGQITEKLRILEDGTLQHLGSLGVREFYAHGDAANQHTWYVDVPVPNDVSRGTFFHIEAAHTHHPSYDSALETWYSCRGNYGTSHEQFRRNTGNGGSWDVSRPNSTTLRVTHNAGTYVGTGPWWVKVKFRQA